ncbi:signal peptidase I [Bacillus cereus]|uniref:signal peptidase I n=1 Tax=Bacillus cereus TaxID=1396 RepID=UPI00356E7381
MTKRSPFLLHYSILGIEIILFLFTSFAFSYNRITGNSMEKTLIKGDKVLVNKMSDSIDDFKRFDIVVAQRPSKEKSRVQIIVKRVVGFPGEKIEYKSRKLFINGTEIKDPFANGNTNDFNLYNLYGAERVPEDMIFVLGDNRENSLDSRSSEIGFISAKHIQGKAIMRHQPFSRFKVF